MIRYIKELFNKKLKCERIGHNMATIEIKIRKESFELREVVADYKAKKQYCKRCGGEHSEPFGLQKVGYFSSCSMPSSMWDSIREQGYVTLSQQTLDNGE